ncbi:uncharacterized protein LOC111637342 [Centruroides sculpturatus]|uniref:uncharacterized protein LOC111637342 n=1 Tax=Centruroides sculpturatus TaxID=218467 RepID=UPI000C6E89E1|nr:uncharacterized protein LOC111637342 [Centruroides sculpturatus]
MNTNTGNGINITYRDVLNSGNTPRSIKNTKTIRQSTEVLLVYQNGEDTSCNRLRNLIYKKVNPSQLNIGVARIRNIARSGLAIELDKQEDVVKLKQYIDHNIPEINARVPKKLLPQIIVYSAPAHINREEIPTLILSQNEIFNEFLSKEDFNKDFTIKFVMGKKTDAFVNWVIEVSPRIRELFLRLGKLNLAWSRCRVADFHPILQCFRCLRYGHSTKNCSKTTPTCSHCSGEHSYRECKNLESSPICCNCKHSKDGCFNHNARDGTCPLFRKIKTNLINRTDYSSPHQ